VLPALLVLTLVFGLLFFTRIGGAYRATILRRWPIGLLAGAAILALLRGALWPAIAFASLAALAWVLWPAIERMGRPQAPVQGADTPEDSAARSLLGVEPNATSDQIRRAYRAKMAQAHPDRGGSHNEAARLTAARDRLLKKKR
jgi:DnaJ family protein C protein 19